MKEENNIAKSYKGFDSNLQCRGFQYEVGKEYSLPEGEHPKVCDRGFHACESPLEVLDYYFMDDDCKIARFCEVEQSGELSKEEKCTKVASSRIKIKAEINFADLIKLGIEWLKAEKVKSKGRWNDNGERMAKIGSRGDSAKIGSSSNCAKIGSSGDYAKIGSSGDYAKIKSTGNDSVIMCAGNDSRAKAKKGSWITLAEWTNDPTTGKWKPKCVKTEYVDGDNIKEDTWYKLENGKFVEA